MTGRKTRRAAKIRRWGADARACGRATASWIARGWTGAPERCVICGSWTGCCSCSRDWDQEEIDSIFPPAH